MAILEKLAWKIISPTDKTLCKRELLAKLKNGRQVPVCLFDVEGTGEPDDSSTSSKSSGSEKKLKTSHTRYYMTCPTDRQNKKLLIIFPGRNMDFFQPDNTFYVQNLYETNMLDEYDIATVIYPDWCSHLDRLTDDCLTALEQIIKHNNYSIANISIMGWSLGGYVSIETLRKYFERYPKHEQCFDCYLNTKSFSSICDFLENMVPNPLHFILRLSFIKKCYVMWNVNACESFAKFHEKIENVYVVYGEKDSVIRGSSRLHRHIKKEIFNRVVVRRDRQTRSHDMNWRLTAKLLTAKSTSDAQSVSSIDLNDACELI